MGSCGFVWDWERGKDWDFPGGGWGQGGNLGIWECVSIAGITRLAFLTFRNSWDSLPVGNEEISQELCGIS